MLLPTTSAEPYLRSWPAIGHEKPRPYFVAGTGKHLYVARRTYRVARCHPPLQPIPTRSIVEHEMTGVPGRDVAVVPWHVIDVCVMTVMLSSMRTTTSQPNRLSRHPMRPERSNGTGSRGVVAWCASCMGNALQLWR